MQKKPTSNKVVYSKMMERDKDGNLITVLVAYEVVSGIRRRLSPSPKIEAPVSKKTTFTRKKK